VSTHQAQEFEAKQAEIVNLTKQVQDLNSQLQAQRTLVVTLETEKQCREELEREAASVRKAELEARRAREVDVEALTLSLSSKTSELAALTQQCELLTQKLQGREEACRGLEGTVSHLEQQRQALTEQLLRTQEQGGGEVSKLQVQAATLTARLAEAERANASLQQQLLELHSRREAQERSQQEAACVEERRKVSTHALSLTHTYTHTHKCHTGVHASLA
jgi:chromosome segregation ATPase